MVYIYPSSDTICPPQHSHVQFSYIWCLRSSTQLWFFWQSRSRISPDRDVFLAAKSLHDRRYLPSQTRTLVRKELPFLVIPNLPCQPSACLRSWTGRCGDDMRVKIERAEAHSRSSAPSHHRKALPQIHHYPLYVRLARMTASVKYKHASSKLFISKIRASTHSTFQILA